METSEEPYYSSFKDSTSRHVTYASQSKVRQEKGHLSLFLTCFSIGSIIILPFPAFSNDSRGISPPLSIRCMKFCKASCKRTSTSHPVHFIVAYLSQRFKNDDDTRQHIMIQKPAWSCVDSYIYVRWAHGKVDWFIKFFWHPNNAPSGILHFDFPYLGNGLRWARRYMTKWRLDV